MKQNTWARNLGLAGLGLCVLITILTVLFTYLGYVLPSSVHTDVAVPIMMLFWGCGLPISFGFAVASCTKTEGRSFGIATFFGHAIFWIVIIAKLFWR